MFNIKAIDSDFVIVTIFTIILLFIFDRISKMMFDKNEIKDFSNNDLLEFPENYDFKNILDINEKNVLYQTLKEFVERYHDYNFIVSLSGGVDSMVLLYLLLRVTTTDRIATASINYNQREESAAELKFIEKYLKNYNLVPYSRTVLGVSRKKENSNRKQFEETSQKIRYELYNDILVDKNWTNKNTIILLGHHLDDLRENIFNNFMLGRKLLDLEVMSEICEKEDLYFGRPFLNYSKSEIYNISHKCNIPYFKDTTPDWSKRGLMRRQLFPLLQQIYPGFEMKLDKQGNESLCLKNLIEGEYIKNFLKVIEVKIVEDGTEFSWDRIYDIKVSNPIIWRELVSTILHKSGYKMVSQKSFKIFLENKLSNKLSNKYYMMSKNVGFKRLKDKTYLLLKK